MPDGGTLRVSCAIRTPEAADVGAVVEATVEDTGQGMTVEFLRDHLFKPFSSTKKGGLGLGLYTSREIVNRQGGSIEVRSEPGRGSRFEIAFPPAGPEVGRP